MLALAGRRIALLERRQRGEFASLVQRFGGEPVSAPVIDEVACHDDFNAFMEGLVNRRFSLAVFLNGAGTSTLLAEAERRGCLSDALAALRQLSIACRGAKTLAELGRYGLRPKITTGATHTTADLLRALSSVDVAGRGVVLVHHGERNSEVAEDLVARGARLKEVCPYERALPEDLGPVTRVVQEAIAHRLDAVLFTNQVQCRHLFDIATQMSQAEGLALSLNRHVVVGAVGPVCARGLIRAGVTADVVPASASMTALVSAVAAYFASHRSGITP